jgi:hypothetical protein
MPGTTQRQWSLSHGRLGMRDKHVCRANIPVCPGCTGDLFQMRFSRHLARGVREGWAQP